MDYKEDLTIKKIEDAEIDKEGVGDLKHKRTVSLESAFGTTITIKGDPEIIPRYRTGEKIQVVLLNPQTQLAADGEEE